MVQATVELRLLGGRAQPCEDTDPALKTDPRWRRYHHLPYPETGRAYDSVSNRPAAQQSPPWEASCRLWWNAVVDWTYIRPQ